jgi:predicted ABC-type ATPase
VSSDGTLDEAVLERIFRRDVVTKVFDGVTPVSAPVGVLVGAQPGAGKTRVVASVLAHYAPCAQIVGDDLRRFHPDFAAVMTHSPLTMPAVTAQAAGQWVERSIDEACRRGVNLVVETTFRRPETVARTARTLRAAGHLVHLEILAVPSAVSRLGTVQRYVAQVAERGSGRWTQAVFHDTAAAMLPETVEQVVTAGLVDHLRIVDRAGRELFAGDPGTDGVAARRSVDAARTMQTMPPAVAGAWVSEYARCTAALLDAGEKDPDVLATLAQLGREGEPIVHAAGTQTAIDQASDAAAAVRRATFHVPRVEPLTQRRAVVHAQLGARGRPFGPTSRPGLSR